MLASQALMYTLSRTYGCHRPCDQFVKRIQDQLALAGLRTLQTFTLDTVRQARTGHPCPHHGWNNCDCQIVVLLVYGCLHEPVTLIVYGNDGQTWLSLPEEALPHLDPVLGACLEKSLQA